MRSGLKLLLRISNWVAPIFFTPSPQKLTRFLGSPLSTTSRKSPIGPDQLAPVLRMYSMRYAQNGTESFWVARCARSIALSRFRSMQYLVMSSAFSDSVQGEMPTLGL